ncbi:SAF domain-containing protein [Mumia sp. zg.B17]|uniref:SAF domain-containing protein n=1 Tax=Mumia sp. zg.B17 TaxID=2855446 RepID=UPI001C6E845C|nr:SAF domain-containing protein [Mumia sp. zg.B17]MBW9205172.1 SAF domain-containing protein [Mumia sp. zg.B17]
MSKLPTASETRTAARLPSTRERRPALAALAVILIVGGALLSGWIAMSSGDRADFLKVQGEVAQGQRLTLDDLGTVSLPEGFDGGVRAGERDSVVGQYATARLLDGTVLSPAMVAESTGVGKGKAQFPIQTPATRSLTELRGGAPIGLYLSGADGDPRGIAAEVVQVGEVDDGALSSSQDITVLVSVDASCGPRLAGALADDSVYLATVGEGADLDDTCGG